ncbi:hypothetical protein D3C72_1846390 [compost metagenome]
MGDAGHLRQLVDLIAGGHGGLHGEGTGGGDHEAAERGDQNLFLLLVHDVLRDSSFVEITLPDTI